MLVWILRTVSALSVGVAIGARTVGHDRQYECEARVLAMRLSNPFFTDDCPQWDTIGIVAIFVAVVLLVASVVVSARSAR